MEDPVPVATARRDLVLVAWELIPAQVVRRVGWATAQALHPKAPLGTGLAALAPVRDWEPVRAQARVEAALEELAPAAREFILAREQGMEQALSPATALGRELGLEPALLLAQEQGLELDLVARELAAPAPVELDLAARDQEDQGAQDLEELVVGQAVRVEAVSFQRESLVRSAKSNALT